MKTLRYVVQLVLGIALPLLLQRWDKRRLSPERRDRAWNTASWAAALYAFGPLSMLGWAWVTRRDLWLRAASRVASVLSQPDGRGRAARAAVTVIAFAISLVVGLIAGVLPVLVAIWALDYAFASAFGLKVEPLW